MLHAEDIRHILDHTRDLWPLLHGARLFLTGGTGFFGKWLTASIAAARREFGLDLRVSRLTRHPDSVPPGFDAIPGDIREFAFPDGSFTHIIHAATPASAALNNARPAEMFDIIVQGTLRTLEFAAHARVQSLLHCSSGAVYGRQPLDLSHTPEDYAGGPDPLSPASAYAEGKRAAELLCALHKAPAVHARCYAFLGPHLPLDAHFAAGNFLRDALAGKPIVIGGDGTPLRSYLHPADLMIWLWTLLLRGQHGRAYNVGCERSVSIAELATLTRAIVNPEGPPVEIRGGPPKPGAAPERYVPSTARARGELGLRTWIPLEDAIRRTAAWHRTTNP